MQPYKKQHESTDSLHAVEITILLEDGSKMTAKGGHAADIYAWLMDCERYCASNPGTVSGYQGPPFNRVDLEGNPISLRRAQ